MKTTTSSSGKLKGKTGNGIKIASFHDVHLGHHRTQTPLVLRGFTDVLNNEAEVSTWDMIAIPGDLFDRCLMMTDPFISDILAFFSLLKRVCERHDIIIRILEGTPGHDWKQSSLFVAMMDALSVTIDVKHVTTLSIEFIDKLGISVLYVPDEWNIDVTQTYDEVLQLMRDRNLDQVDFCLFHGAFNYQIDEHLNPKAHSEELWCKLVRYYILAGHVHIRSQYKNILVAGSFDRLAHGEEHDKGWLTVEIKPNGEQSIIFHKNPYATIYKTIDVREKSVDESLALVDKMIQDYPKHSHIRLYVTERDAIKDGLKELKMRHPTFHFTLKVEAKKEKQRTIKLVETLTETIDLTRDNIARIISTKLDEHPNIDKDKILNVLQQYL